MNRRVINIEMDNREMSCKDVGWFQLAHDKVKKQQFVNMLTGLQIL